jgi:hypothetical protein
LPAGSDTSLTVKHAEREQARPAESRCGATGPSGRGDDGRGFVERDPWSGSDFSREVGTGTF